MNSLTGPWKDFYILNHKIADVNGDSRVDYIYILGKLSSIPESAFREDLTLLIIDGRYNTYTMIPLKDNAGYNPTLFVQDFTKDGIKDILISIDSGGSGGLAYYYMYSYRNNKYEKVFDYEEFNKKYSYKVNYMDDYQVEVINEKSRIRYIINIEYKGKDYLDKIYNENRKLKEPIKGNVNPLGGVYPVDFQRDGNYELYTFQRITGLYNADGLGYMETSLEWSKNKFSPFFQMVGIYGEEK